MWAGLPKPKPTEDSQVLQRVWTGANPGRGGVGKVPLACSHLSLGTSSFLGWSSIFRGLEKWGHFSAQARPSRTLQGH